MEAPPLGPVGEDITWPDQVAPRGRKASSTRKIKPQTSNLKCVTRCGWTEDLHPFFLHGAKGTVDITCARKIRDLWQNVPNVTKRLHNLPQQKDNPGPCHTTSAMYPVQCIRSENTLSWEHAFV